jgi:hypothetical protein
MESLTQAIENLLNEPGLFPETEDLIRAALEVQRTGNPKVLTQFITPESFGFLEDES